MVEVKYRAAAELTPEFLCKAAGQTNTDSMIRPTLAG